MKSFAVVPATLAAALCLALSGCGMPGESRSFQVLAKDAEPLRTAFNNDVGRTRVLMLVGPTCGVCLRGAADIESTVLARNNDPRLRGYVVWVPMLGARELDVPEATRTVPDPRAEHYWNPGGELMDATASVLGLDQQAWDVYLGYGPTARWDGAPPPKPDFWMHQLGGTEVGAPRLDAAAFEARTAELLSRPVQ